MNIYILNLIIPFVIRQILKFEQNIDWKKVKVDAEIRIRKLIPGNFFDDQAAKFANETIDKISEIIDEEKLKKIIELITHGSFEKSITTILSWIA